MATRLKARAASYGTSTLLTGTPAARRPLLPPGIELLELPPGETIDL